MIMKKCRLLPVLFFLVLLFFISACVSTKKITYLQDTVADVTPGQQALIKSINLNGAQYRLKPDDRLLVNIFSLTEEKLNFIKKPEMELRVDDTGLIRLPVMGAIQVGNLTVKETEEKLKRIASEYLRSPEISVKLLSFNVTVLGEVFRQGAFNVTEPKINILEAIGHAGGVTENANMKNIRIIRNQNDTAKIYKLNMLEDNMLTSTNYFLQPNDIVLVNPLKAKSSSQQRTATIGLVISILSSIAWFLKK